MAAPTLAPSLPQGPPRPGSVLDPSSLQHPPLWVPVSPPPASVPCSPETCPPHPVCLFRGLEPVLSLSVPPGPATQASNTTLCKYWECRKGGREECLRVQGPPPPAGCFCPQDLWLPRTPGPPSCRGPQGEGQGPSEKEDEACALGSGSVSWRFGGESWGQHPQPGPHPNTQAPHSRGPSTEEQVCPSSPRRGALSGRVLPRAGDLSPVCPEGEAPGGQVD